MKNYLKHIDDFFREKLGRYTETPPSDVWDALDARLDGLAAPSAPQTGGAYRWLKHFGMVSVIAVLIVPLLKKISNKEAMASTMPSEQVIAKADIAPSATEGSNIGETPAANAAVTEHNGTKNTIAGTENNGGDVVVSGNESTATTVPQGHKPVVAAAKHKSGTVTAKSHQTTSHKPEARTALYSQPVTRNVTGHHSDLSKPGLESEENEPVTELTQTTGWHPAKPFGTSDNEQKPAPLAAKKIEIPSDKKKTATTNKEDKAHQLSKFEIGVKVGYERGFNDLVATKYVISPYLQYNLSDKFSLMAQPGIKYASVNTHTIGAPRSYYKTNDDGTVTPNGTTQKGYIVEGGSISDSSFTTNYRYKQSHDSIVKSYTHGGTYMEFELPILLKYTIVPKLSVYGGVNINYSKQTAITEHTYTKQGIVRYVDSTTTTFGAPGHLAVSDVIVNNGTSYTDYKAPVYANTQNSSLRFGYMVGFSYEYSNRWLIDALMQQTPVKPYLQGGYNMNTSLSAPYFRLSVGYKLTK
ncbi:MAG: hypothetical protein JWQ38_324 [Flavipsychrobacter sp.]|nr:hypothetical protein [Flavipsychrobacter sp.]